MMGITERRYQRCERGEGKPKLARWIWLADYFQVSLDYLVGWSEDPTLH